MNFFYRHAVAIYHLYVASYVVKNVLPEMLLRGSYCIARFSYRYIRLARVHVCAGYIAIA